MSILKDFQRKEIKRDFGDLKELLEKYLYRDDHPRRVELREMYRAGHSLTGKNGLRRLLGAFDLEFFGKAYLPHYFSRETPEFHRELDALWTSQVLKNEIPDNKETVDKLRRMPGSKNVVAAPRGHAKSTTFTFKNGLHATVYEYKPYIIILSDSSDQAEGFLEDIRTELEDNEAIREDFGDLVGKKVWRNDVLLTATDIKIDGIGSGKKIRGRRHRNWRPSLFLLDDIENDQNVATPEQRKKLSNWLLKAVLKAGDDYTDTMMLGTILDWDSLLSNILKNPGFKARVYKAVLSWATRQDLWDQWKERICNLEDEDRLITAKAYFERNREAMLEGTQVLWEAKFSYYDLMVMLVTEGEAAFYSEEQNEPLNPEDCIIKEEWIDEYNPEAISFRSGFDFYGFCDPSLGKSKRSDYSAIETLAKDSKTGYLYDADADIERRHPDQIIEDILQKEIWLRTTYGKGFTKFGIETNQFQWYLKEQLAKRSAELGIYLPIVEVNQTGDKMGRLQTLQPDIKNKYIKINRKHKLLKEQLTRIRKDGHGGYDDGPDALEGARTLAKGSWIDLTLAKIFQGVKIWPKVS